LLQPDKRSRDPATATPVRTHPPATSESPLTRTSIGGGPHQGVLSRTPTTPRADPFWRSAGGYVGDQGAVHIGSGTRSNENSSQSLNGPLEIPPPTWRATRSPIIFGLPRDNSQCIKCPDRPGARWPGAPPRHPPSTTPAP